MSSSKDFVHPSVINFAESISCRAFSWQGKISRSPVASSTPQVSWCDRTADANWSLWLTWEKRLPRLVTQPPAEHAASHINIFSV